MVRVSRYFWQGASSLGEPTVGRFGLARCPAVFIENGGLPRFLAKRELLDPSSFRDIEKHQQLRQYRRALSQAVIYQRYTAKSVRRTPNDLAAMEMVRKVIERGALCPPHPAIEKLIEDRYRTRIFDDVRCNDTFDGEQLSLGTTLRLIEGWAVTRVPKPCSTAIHSYEDDAPLGAGLERERWAELQRTSNGALRRWSHPQVFLRHIVQREKTDGRRVDFVICPPFWPTMFVWECHGEFSSRDRDKQAEIRRSAAHQRLNVETIDEVLNSSVPSLPSIALEDRQLISSAAFCDAVDASWTSQQLDHALFMLLVDGQLGEGASIHIRVPEQHEQLATETVVQFRRLVDVAGRIWTSSIGHRRLSECRIAVNSDTFDADLEVDIDPAGHTYLGEEDAEIRGLVVRRACMPFDGPSRHEAFPFPPELQAPVAPSEPSAEDLLPILERAFGLSSFRDRQVEAIQRAVRTEDVIVLLPTGYGKSLIFYMASMIRPGTTIVVAGWKSLIDDQYRKLAEFGITRVVRIHSDAREHPALADAILVFVAPERLYLSEFDGAVLRLMRESLISLLVIDEAHAVAIAGHDFRPAYLGVRHRIRAFSSRVGREAAPVLALTATASEPVVREIRTTLEINSEPVSLTSGYARPELFDQFEHIDVSHGAQAVRRAVRQILGDDRTRGRGIIYCSSKGEFGNRGNRWYGVEGTAAEVRVALDEAGQTGRKVCRYVGGDDMSADERAAQVRVFINSDDSIMVATDAFGAGIDIPKVRWVVQVGLPLGIEAFAQQMGRAGRSGDLSHGFVVHDDPKGQLLTSLQDKLEGCLDQKVKDPVREVQRLVESTGWDACGSTYRSLFLMFGKPAATLSRIDFSQPAGAPIPRNAGNELDGLAGDWLIEKLVDKADSCKVDFHQDWETVILKGVLRLCWLGMVSPSYTVSSARSGLKTVDVELVVPLHEIDVASILDQAKLRAARYLNADTLRKASAWLETKVADAKDGVATCKYVSRFLARATNRAVAITRVRSILTLLDYAIESDQDVRRAKLNGYFTDDSFTRMVREVSSSVADAASWRRAAEEFARDPSRTASLRRLQEDPITAPLATFLLLRANASAGATLEAGRELARLINTSDIDVSTQSFVWDSLRADFNSQWDGIVSNAVERDSGLAVVEFAARRMSMSDGESISASAVVARLFSQNLREKI